MSKKTSEMTPLQYGVHLVKNPQTGKKKVGATVVETGTVSINAIAAEISRSTTVTSTDVHAVIEALIEFTVRRVCEGYRIELGNLGKFYPTITVKTTAKLEDFDQNKITGVKCRFDPSEKFENLLSQVVFTKVLPRKQSNKAMADYDSAMAAALAAQAEEPDPENP